MTEPLNLAPIAAREAAATPGPWENHPQYGHDFYAYLGGEYLSGVGDLNFGTGDDAEADLAFVLASRQDVPALLAEIRRLRAELARTRDVLKATQQASAEDPVTCESCGHIESAHDPDGDRDCHASGARVFACSCSYFIPCYPAPAAEGV